MSVPFMPPAPVFVGFVAKRTAAADKSFFPSSVVDVAAVSNCISSPPDGWVDRWLHNDHGFYDSEDLARSIVPNEQQSKYDLYAYEMVPVEFGEELKTIDVRSAPGGVPDDFDLLGYDIVSRSIADYFECSPLSCNSAAAEFGANEHCLISSFRVAYEAFVKIGQADDGYEPGPYYLFAVYRKRGHRA